MEEAVGLMREPLRRKFLVLSLIFLMVCFSGTAYGAVYYVDNSGSPTCSDSSSYGSEAHPCCTINYSVDRVAAGDTVYVKNGTYNENVYISGKSGGAGYITFRNHAGHSPLLYGDGVNSGRNKIINSSYIQFLGFRITNYNQGFFVEDSSNILLQNLTIYGVGQEGVHIRDNSSYVTLQDSLIHDTRAWQYNGEGIYIGTSSSSQPGNPPYDTTNNITIKGNTIYNTNDECIELKPGTHDVVVDGNTMYNCLLDPSITATNWGYVEVMNPEGFYGSNPNHTIKNNTIHGTKTALGIHTGSTTFNNVIYGQTGSYPGISIDNPDSDSYTRYIYHNTVDLPNARAIVRSSGTADIRNNIGPTTANNLATSSGYFINQAAADYHLVGGSAPIKAGVDLRSTVPLDHDGITRNSQPDIGAYEFTEANPPQPPLKLRIVP